MSMPDDDAFREAELRSYHLGTLSQERQQEIEDLFLADEDLHAELQATVDDLIHAYLAGRLTAEDRERFETHFLASRGRSDRVAFIRTLVSAVDHVEGPSRAADEQARRRPSRIAVWAPWAAALLLALIAGGLSVGDRRRSARERSEAQGREERLQQELKDSRARVRDLEMRPDGSQAIPTWTLRPDLQRDGDADAFDIRSEWVRLRVPLPPGMRAASYRARVETSAGHLVFYVEGLAEASAPDKRTVEAMVPTQRLPPGSYVISILNHDGRPPAELAAVAFFVR